MSLGSPRANETGRLVYCEGPEVDANGVEDIDSLTCPSAGDGTTGEKERIESMYVVLFEDMLNVVFGSELYLFNDNEFDCLARYAKLSYEARYLFVRLCLRKTDQWLKLGDLKYQKELGVNIIPAIRELCSCAPLKSAAPKVKTEERDDIIDLTSSQGEQSQPCAASLTKPGSSLQPPFTTSCSEPDYSVFADDESRASMRDILECLKTDELREIVKIMHVQKKENKRDSLISVLLNSTSGQSTLPFAVVSSTKSKKSNRKKLVQAPLTSYMPQKRRNTQQDRLRVVVTEQIGACIKLNPDVVKLFRRINVVYFRSTQYTATLLTQAILARCKKRHYAAVEYRRSDNLWESRDALLKYEAALEWEAQIDEIWGSGSTGVPRSRSRSVASKTPAPGPRLRSECTQSPDKRDMNTVHESESVMGESIYDKPRMRDAREVKAVFEKVLPLWREVVVGRTEETVRTGGLERFHHGHVLTRIVCKGAEALGILKEYEAELDILEELLAQRRWRRGRRGRWHERRALLLMTHFPKDRETHKRAYNVVMEALQDNDTHIVYRPKLLRRLRTLEKKLFVPENERVLCAGSLQEAEERFITGARVRTTIDVTGKITVADTKLNKAEIFDSKTSRFAFQETATSTKVQVPWTGKSIWVGNNDEKVNVEILALQHYEKSGFKGFHCEGRIVTTIFGLLFWDIIFACVPGAFETEYQIAPLDIAEETFYTSRQELIQARLDEIREGKGEALLTASYDEHSLEKRVCVGVRWDLFERQDLLEIVECLDPAGLAAICQVIAEDYGNRTAGVPDLIVWNKAELICKFVEVKGPGDNLQENQKIWIAVMLQAGISVEVCHVLEEGQDEPKSKPAKSSAQRKRKRRELEDDALESEDEVDYSQFDRTQEALSQFSETAGCTHEGVFVGTGSPLKKSRRDVE